MCRECISIAKEYNMQRPVKMKPPIIKEIIYCVQMDVEQKKKILELKNVIIAVLCSVAHA